MMKKILFWKKSGKCAHYLLRIASLAGAALLASTACIRPAHSFDLERDRDGRVIGIKDLQVEDQFFNVDFFFGSYDEFFKGTFPFPFPSVAENAARNVIVALGTHEFTSKATTAAGDGFLIPFGFDERDPSFVKSYTDSHPFSLPEDGVGLDLRRRTQGPDEFFPWAGFTPTDEFETPVATPEPSLIVGFITLGGLMLGSKRKTKG